MKKLKNRTYAIVILIPILLILAILYVYPIKTEEVNRSINCVEVYSQEVIPVIIKGVYHRYLLRNDCFVGTIIVVGKRTCTRDFTFKHDRSSYFVDDLGQPHGEITQYNVFESIIIAEDDYIVTSINKN